MRATASAVSSVLGFDERCDQCVDLAFEPGQALTLSADVFVEAADPGIHADEQAGDGHSDRDYGPSLRRHE